MCRASTSFLKLQAREVDKRLARGITLAHDGAMLLWNILQGLSSGLRVHESPLYRYPYRSAEEAFRGDAKRVRDDIEKSLEQGHEG